MLDPAIDPAGLAGVAGPAAHSLVSWLGTYLVHSSVLIGGVWALSRALPLDALTRSSLWKMALVGGLCTATLQTGLGVEPLLGSVSVAAGSPTPAPTVLAPPPVEVEEAGAPLLVPFTRACAGCEPNMVAFGEPEVAAGFAVAPLFVESPPPSFVRAPAATPAIAVASPPRGPGAVVWLFAGLFVLGAAASIGRLAGTFGQLRRTLRGRRVVGAGPLRVRLSRLLAHADVPEDSVRLTMSHRIGSPVALAGREIVVPGRANTLSPRQQEALLAHELAHVLRRDPAWQVMSAVIEAALFFQPLNRVARRGMEQAAEELCDDWAVRHTGSRLDLARCLAEVAAWPGRKDMSGLASAMTGGGSPLVHRVERLLDGRQRERGRWARGWRGLLGAALLAVVAFGAPGLSLGVAEASEPAEWPTSPDNGPGSEPRLSLVRIPELPALPMFAVASGQVLSGHQVIVVKQPELTRRQRRLLRRAERHARKAAKLRAKTGLQQGNGVYKAVYVPVAPVAPHYKVVVADMQRPVHVVEHDDCDEDDDDDVVHAHKIVVPRIEIPRIEVDIGAALKAGEEAAEAAERAMEAELEDLDETIERSLAAVDFDRISADVERQVEQALRGAERARGQAEKAREKAERARERSQRDVRRQAERAQREGEKARRHGEAVKHEVDRALRDGAIDAEEQRRIGEAARKAGKRR